MGGEERFVGAGDVSRAQPDAAELADRPSQLAAKVGPQLLARLERFGLGLVAPSPQPQDLGSVHAAPTVEAADGVGVGPPLHRLGPLLGQVVLRQSLQRAHQLAVHDAGRQRVELAGRHRHPGLLEQGQASLDLAVEDQQARLARRVRWRRPRGRTVEPTSMA